MARRAAGRTALDLTLDRAKVRRHPDRGRYDRQTIDAILDEALVCHVSFVVDGEPRVLPTIPVRIEDAIYLHGAPAAAMLAVISRGEPIAVCATLVDGLVLARSVYNHSLNFRSVVVYGRGEEVMDHDEKMEALRQLVEHVAPGRSQEARMPNDREIRATRVVKVHIEEAAAKVRTGPPKDDQEDLDLPVWAGVLPFVPTWGDPIADDLLPPGVPLTASLATDGPLAGARP